MFTRLRQRLFKPIECFCSLYVDLICKFSELDTRRSAGAHFDINSRQDLRAVVFYCLHSHSCQALAGSPYPILVASFERPALEEGPETIVDVDLKVRGTVWSIWSWASE